MADIDVVPKQRTNTWIWVLLAVIILAVLFFFLSAGRTDALTTLQQLEALPSLPNRAVQALFMV